MTEAETHVGCGIPSHPQNYAHAHLGGWQDCIDCQNFVTFNLIGAAASVGIERGMSTAQTLNQYMAVRHAQHKGSEKGT